MAQSGLRATPLDPATISNLVVQFRADSITGLIDGDAVASWTPAAGAETAAAAQATSGQRPVYHTNRINGLPSVVFTSGSSQNLDTGAWVTSRAVPNSAFVVARRTADTLDANYFSGRAGVLNYIGITSDALAIGAGAASELTTAAGTGLNTWYLYLAEYNGASSAIYVNAFTPSVTGTTGSGASANMPGMRISATSAGTANFITGDIAEIIFYDRVLTAGERSGVLAWLNRKYALGLAVPTIPLRPDQPTVATTRASRF